MTSGGVLKTMVPLAPKDLSPVLTLANVWLAHTQ